MNAKSASTYFDISTAGDESAMSKQKERMSLRARRFIFRNFTASSFKGSKKDQSRNQSAKAGGIPPCLLMKFSVCLGEGGAFSAELP